MVCLRRENYIIRGKIYKNIKCSLENSYFVKNKRLTFLKIGDSSRDTGRCKGAFKGLNEGTSKANNQYSSMPKLGMINKIHIQIII